MSEIKRCARASEIQKEFLINFLEENIDIANDKFVCVDGAKFRDCKWAGVAESLNSMGGAIKDGTRWRKYWSDLKSHTRAKYNDMKENRSGINGPNRKSLTSLEERIIQLQSIEAIEGDLVPEIGFVEAVMDLSGDFEFSDENLTPQPTVKKPNVPVKRKLETNSIARLEQMEEKKIKLMEEKNNLLKESNTNKREMCSKLNVLITLIKDKI